jgi:hypothetical protein
MPNTLNDRDWENLMRRIKDEKCTPFIGAGACAGTLPLGSEIARGWAKEFKYPLKDDWDLARVSQFIAIEQDDMFPKDDIQRQFRSKSPPDFTQPDEPHALLAELNLPMYITTNYDSFMDLALKSRNRTPERELCRWNGFVQQKVKSVFGDEKKPTDYEPTSTSPLVYHLHGHYDLPQSLVLTEDDYLDFLNRLSSDPLLLPSAVRTALAGTSLLFIGYSLSDWNFRVLFRGLIGSLGASLGYTGVAVQLSPDAYEDSESGRDRAQKYLDKYFPKIQKIKVRVYWGDIKEFTAELRQRWEKFTNDTK